MVMVAWIPSVQSVRCRSERCFILLLFFWGGGRNFLGFFVFLFLSGQLSKKRKKGKEKKEKKKEEKEKKKAKEKRKKQK
jgi:hypothetical protein